MEEVPRDDRDIGSQPQRRSTDGMILETARNADVGISFIWRWGNMLVTLIGFGVVLGTFYAKFGSIEDKIADLVKQGDEVKKFVRQSDLDHLEIAHQKETIGDLKRENVELRGKVDNMVDQRTAYILTAANRVLNGQKSTITIPP